MGSLNKWIGIGRLGSDPELKLTPNGNSVVNISMAIDESYKDQSGQHQSRTEWIRLVLWSRMAEILNQYCRKGSQIFVEGSLQTREWQDKTGNKRYVTEVIVRNLQLLAGKQDGGTPSVYQQTTPPSTDQIENDMPF